MPISIEFTWNDEIHPTCHSTIINEKQLSSHIIVVIWCSSTMESTQLLKPYCQRLHK